MIVCVKAKRKDADAVWCHDCGRMIADRLQPWWNMHKSKAMHEKGTTHKTEYVKYEATS